MDNELSWSKTQVTIDEFYQLIPLREVKASQSNNIKIIYDDKYLYIFAKAITKDGKASVPSLERDYQIRGTDAIFFLLDTYSDSSNAFWFESTSSGVKKDALISNGGRSFENDIDFSWDIRFDVLKQLNTMVITVWNLKSLLAHSNSPKDQLDGKLIFIEQILSLIHI